MFLNCSTCFGRHTAHHQELKNCNGSLGFYIRLWLPVAAAMAEPSQWQPATKNVCKTRGCSYSVCTPGDGRHVPPKHVQQLQYIGIINSSTQLHLVGSMRFILRCTDPWTSSSYLKVVYFQALGYVKLDIICGYSLLSFFCDEVPNTVVLWLHLIFICIRARARACVCVCVCVRTNTIQFQTTATSSAHNWDKHRSNTF
jgi:hypothetical protein